MGDAYGRTLVRTLGLAVSAIRTAATFVRWSRSLHAHDAARAMRLERDARYAAIARERMAAESNGQSLRDARAGQLPMFGTT